MASILVLRFLLLIKNYFYCVFFIGNAKKEHSAIPKDDLLLLFHFIDDENVLFENHLHLKKAFCLLAEDPYP